MAITLNGIVCQELVQNYRETYSWRDGPSARKGYLCAWNSRYQAAHGLLGLSVTQGGVITLTTPLPFPELALESTNALASMYCLSVDIEPAGAPTQGTYQTVWTYAKIYANYAPIPWSWSGADPMQLDPTRPYVWAEQHLSYSSEYIVIPKGKLTWSTGATDADWGFPSPLVECTITLKNVPYLPFAATLAASQAPINSATYLGIAPGYLLFNGATDTPAHTSDGSPARDITLSFLARTVAPWDSTYNAKMVTGIGGTTGGWDQVLTQGGQALIARSDLSTLIPSAYY